MDSFYHSTLGVPTSQANQDVTPPAALSLTLPPAGNGGSLVLGQHQPHGPTPAAINPDDGTQPPAYTKSDPGTDSICEQPPAYDSLPPLRQGLNPAHGLEGGSISVGAPNEFSSPDLCNCDGDTDPTGPETLTLAQEVTTSYCATNRTSGPEKLLFDITSDNVVCRWLVNNTPIPVGIDLSGFERHEQGMGAIVQRCLITVLDKLNAHKVGPGFEFVSDPFDSAFFVTFGGHDQDYYARAFFPGSNPEYWYIYVYSLGLTLSQEQSDFLSKDTVGDIQTARLQALERKLVSILTHEMLHVVGIRHCDAHLTERDHPCMRFPPNATDAELKEELLMHRKLHWEDLSWVDWNHRTLEEIRQIYMEGGTHIEGYEIRDVSWQDGAKVRKEAAWNNARCCIPKAHIDKWGLLMRVSISWCLAGFRNLTRHWF